MLKCLSLIEVIADGFCFVLLLYTLVFPNFFTMNILSEKHHNKCNIYLYFFLKLRLKDSYHLPFLFYILSAMVYNYIIFSVFTQILEYVVCY